MILGVVFLFVCHQCSGYIYHLSEEDHARMPPLYFRDDYSSCIDAHAQYCSVDFHLTSNGSSPLYDMILEYSAFKPTHFNHTRLKYGLCVTHTCKQFLQEGVSDQSMLLEKCLNEVLYKNYSFGAKVVEYYCSDDKRTPVSIDALDICVAVLVLVILVLNIVGSLGEFMNKRINTFLSCFSIKRNWDLLTAIPKPEDEGTKSFQAFYGLRAINMVFVIGCHSFLIFAVNVENSRLIEEMYNFLKVLANGTVIVQTFLVISGFLMALTVLKHEEKGPLTLGHVFKGIVVRWLRLVVCLAFMLAIIATWMRFVGSGPLWNDVILKQSADCRRDWWVVLLMANNYNAHSECMPEAWYIPVDMQLTAVSLVLCLLKGWTRGLMMTLLLVGGMVASAVQTYLMNLDAAVLISPNSGQDLFISDPTFHTVYISGHTNTASYVLGFAAAYLLQRLKKHRLHEHAISRIIIWGILPFGFCWVAAGSLYYGEFWPGPVVLRAAWAAFHKAGFGFLVAVYLVAFALKIEKVYSWVLSWKLWTVPGRLTFCTYLTHLTVIRLVTALRTSLLTLTAVNMIITIVLVVVMSFLAALPLWLLVEAPSGNLVKMMLSKPRPRETKRNVQECKL